MDQLILLPHAQMLLLLKDASSHSRLAGAIKRVGPVTGELGAENSSMGGCCRWGCRERHLLIWPWARKSAMSALQVGHGFMIFRSRMVRPVATGLSGPVPMACIVLQAVSPFGA